MEIRAIIFGATGMVGEGVLHEALLDPDVGSVLVIGRRSCGVTDPRLTELLHNDFYDFNPIRGRLSGYNACFFCLGVTSIGKKEPEYRKLTYDLTLAAAKTLSGLNPDMVFCYVSGAGTDSTEKGRIMWARVKGKTENDLMKLPFRAVYAFRPGYIRPIKGLRNSLAGSKIVAPLYPVMRFFLPKQVCTMEEVGRSMLHVVKSGYPRSIIDNETMHTIAKA